MIMHFVIASLGFPLWLRISHYIDLLFIGLLIHSGIQILGAHPRLYRNDDCKPESNWLNLTHKKIPKDKLWTSMDEEVQVRQLVERAVRIAKTERSVTCIIIPKDVQDLDAVETPPHKNNTIHTGTGYSYPHIIPAEADLQRAADILNEGKKVAILVGAGALHAGQEVAEVAELLGSGVAKALLGKAVLSDYLPFVTWRCPNITTVY